MKRERPRPRRPSRGHQARLSTRAEIQEWKCSILKATDKYLLLFIIKKKYPFKSWKLESFVKL